MALNAPLADAQMALEKLTNEFSRTKTDFRAKLATADHSLDASVERRVRVRVARSRRMKALFRNYLQRLPP